LTEVEMAEAKQQYCLVPPSEAKHCVVKRARARSRCNSDVLTNSVLDIISDFAASSGGGQGTPTCQTKSRSSSDTAATTADSGTGCNQSTVLQSIATTVLLESEDGPSSSSSSSSSAADTVTNSSGDDLDAVSESASFVVAPDLTLRHVHSEIISPIAKFVRDKAERFEEDGVAGSLEIMSTTRAGVKANVRRKRMKRRAASNPYMRTAVGNTR
jgi:hypothetical protein